MLKYEDFLNEGRGISDIIKQYTKIINDYHATDGLEKIQLDFDYEQLPLIDLRVIFKKSDRNNGNFILDSSEIINSKLHDVVINIEYKNTEDIIGLISHELNHINEYYKIQIKILTTNINIRPTWIDIKLSYSSLNITNDHSYYYFIYLLYLSLDTEMNARISQVYNYLLSFNITDEDQLFEKLKQHQNWKYVDMLNNFNYDEFIKHNIDVIGLNGIIKITNQLIDKFKDKNLNKRTKLLHFVDKNITNLNDLVNFYKNFHDYFISKTKTHMSKFKYIINEVIEDINGNRPFNEANRIT
jgi:hypothetical protein